MWRAQKRRIDDADRVIGDPARARTRTMERAVRLLAAKPRSIGELRARLLEKAWTDQEIVDETIGKLKEYKYLDDRQYARDLAASKLRQKPQGKRRLAQTMGKKQLDREVADEAINLAFEKMPESELIELVIEKRLRLKGSPNSREEEKKFYDHLLRQGFSYDLVSTKMNELRDRKNSELHGDSSA